MRSVTPASRDAALRRVRRLTGATAVGSVALTAAFAIASAKARPGQSPARAAAYHVAGEWADRYGDAVAGALIAAVGLVVIGLGL